MKKILFYSVAILAFLVAGCSENDVLDSNPVLTDEVVNGTSDVSVLAVGDPPSIVDPVANFVGTSYVYGTFKVYVWGKGNTLNTSRTVLSISNKTTTKNYKCTLKSTATSENLKIYSMEFKGGLLAGTINVSLVAVDANGKKSSYPLHY